MSISLPERWEGVLRSQRRAEPATALEELRRRGGFRLRATADVLHVRGNDRLDLIHRLCASPVRPLADGTCVPAIFTNDRGRMLDLALVSARERELVLLSTEGRREALREWIARYTIMEDVTTEIREEWVVDLWMPPGGGGTILRRLGISAEVGRMTAAEQGRLWLRPSAPVAGLMHAVLDESEAEALWLELLETDLRPVDQELWRAWAILSGHPLLEATFRAGANPLELGLSALIGWNKGCYIGQEVLARLDTYDKVRRRAGILQGARSGPAAAEELYADGRKVGLALGRATDPRGDGFVALVAVDKTLTWGAELRWDEGAGILVEIPAH